MEPFWPYYAFLISWIQCFIVVWLAVSIETQSTDVSTTFDNSTSDITTLQPASTKSVVTFANDVVMPICPPPNNLHLLCSVTLGGNNLNCEERANVLELCWNKSRDIYVNSSWSECQTSCDDVVDILTEFGVLTKTVKTTTEASSTSAKVPVPVTSPLTSTISTISTSSSNSSNSSLSPSLSPEQSSSSTAANSSIDITSVLPPVIVSSPRSGRTMANDADPSLLPINSVYPIIGCIGILIEVVILCYIFCFRKRKRGSMKMRRGSQEPVVIQEEMMEAESTNPTQALYNGPGALAVPDVIAEDQHIFRSYLNLRFIDDSSLEGTPEKIIIK